MRLGCWVRPHQWWENGDDASGWAAKIMAVWRPTTICRGGGSRGFDGDDACVWVVTPRVNYLQSNSFRSINSCYILR